MVWPDGRVNSKSGVISHFSHYYSGFDVVFLQPNVLKEKI
jgi:hypothetical protein